MSKTEELKNLFEKWKSEHFPTEVFYKDGIINESEFADSKLKILFITKEPNGKNHENYNEPYSDFVDEWSNQIPRYRFAKRIAEWSYGLLNNFDRYNEEAVQQLYLKKIAFMNVKKSGGGSVTKEIDFFKFINSHGDGYITLINQQIEIIQPEVVVLGLSWERLINKLFPNLTWTRIDNTFPFATNKNVFYINCYHPSVRIISKEICYQKLQDTFKFYDKNVLH